MRQKRGRWGIIIGILLLGAVLLLWILVWPGKERSLNAGNSTHSVRKIMADLRYERRIKLIREELDTAKEEEYAHLFLSMYPISSYDTYYISYWRGLETFKAEMVMENGRELAGTLEYLDSLSIVPETVFLGLDPECLEEEYPLETSLLPMIRETPGTSWEIFVANPSMDYWREKEEKECQAVIDRYEKAIASLVQEENAKVFFACDKEWLVCNSSNYAQQKMPTEDVATMLLAYYIRGEYQLTLDNLEQRMTAARELIADWYEDDRTLAGMEDTTLLFIGDSTFGNFTGSLAVTGVVEAFTGAAVLNCGYGGMAAAYGDPQCPALGDLLQAIDREDSSGIDPKENVPPAVQTAAVLKQTVAQGENMVIFLVFGINDYIKGFPVSSEDPYDTDTYAGALRTGIEELKGMFPQAQLVLMSPNFIIYNQYGTNPVGEGAYVFTDYVKTVLELAEEYALPVLDNYGELGIDRDNAAEYLQDEVHLNEAGRFEMGMRILELLNGYSNSANQNERIDKRPENHTYPHAVSQASLAILPK